MEFHAFLIWNDMQVASFILWLLLLPGSLQHACYKEHSGFHTEDKSRTNQKDKMYSSGITNLLNAFLEIWHTSYTLMSIYCTYKSTTTKQTTL